MAYFIKDLNIADVTPPAKVSLADNPNYVIFESKGKDGFPHITFSLKVTGINHDDPFFVITETNTGIKHYFSGVPGWFPIEVTGKDELHFFEMTQMYEYTAENIAEAFKQDSYLSTWYNISLESNIVHLVSKDTSQNEAYLFKYNTFNSEDIFLEPSKDPYLTSDRVEIELDVVGKGFHIYNEEIEGGITLGYNNITKFTITEERTKTPHVFEGTTDIADIGGGKFYLGPRALTPLPTWDLSQIAESLKNCLQENDFMGTNFDITIPPVRNSNGTFGKGTKIKIRAKGSGGDYAFKLEPEDVANFSKDFINVTGNPEEIVSNDSISEGYSPVEIHLDIHKNTGVFLGMDDTPNEGNMGTYVMTLTKAYSYTPLWFNTNILKSDKLFLDFSKTSRWFDPGTVQDYRFTAKRFIASDKHYENSLFLYSNVHYAITGYQRTLEKNDLSEYVYDFPDNEGNVKPLTTQPQLTHIKGQTQYFNFIASDSNRDIDLGEIEYTIGLGYKLYSQSGRYLMAQVSDFQDRKLFSVVNSIKINIDDIIKDRDDVGIVEVFLTTSSTQYTIISQPISFRILPECMYPVNDFAFLNSLGGWSSFNFPGTAQTDFKATTNTIYRTHTPDKNIHDTIESVYNKEVEEKFTVQTMPITREVCDWLKELSTSKAVYELATERYVVVDELNIKQNSKDDLFRLEMKYHYSDSYNGAVK